MGDLLHEGAHGKSAMAFGAGQQAIQTRFHAVSRGIVDAVTVQQHLVTLAERNGGGAEVGLGDAQEQAFLPPQLEWPLGGNGQRIGMAARAKLSVPSWWLNRA